MIAIASSILGALIGSEAGRMVLVGVVCIGIGFVGGFREGDKGRVLLQARIAAATAELQSRELARNAEIAAQGERDELEEEKAEAERQKLLDEANQRIAELEKRPAGKECVISRDTVRQINRAH